METVTIVGSGRAGGALAIALQRAGWAVERIVFRKQPPERLSAYFHIDTFTAWEDLASIGSDLLIIATADPDIGNISSRAAGFPNLPRTALHLSGSLDSRVLAALADKGVATGSAHPLVSISDPILGAERFTGCYFCLEGSEPALETAGKLAESLGAESFSIATEFKPLYHAAAVMASGHLTALLDAAIETLARCGLSAEDAKRVLFPLISSTVSNLESQTTAEALTGTFARGDAAALERHLESIGKLGLEDVREIYLALGRRSIDLLNREGIDKRRLDAIERAIYMAKENSR